MVSHWLKESGKRSLDGSDCPCLKWMDKMEPCVFHGQKVLYLLTSYFPASNRSRPAPLLSIPNNPGLIGTTKKLSYSQTGKMESPDLKVG
ncbi:unnamed protein product [Brassica rapa subsp. narinosa]